MGVLDILYNWVAPFLDPMKGFRAHGQSLSQIHANSLAQFQKYQGNLDDMKMDSIPVTKQNNPLQQNTRGNFADALNNTGTDFIQLERDLSNAVGDIDKLAKVAEDFDTIIGRIELALEEASLKLEGEEGLMEITAEVDIAAVAEGGVNVIADVAGLILTIIEGSLLIETLKDLGQEIYDDVQRLKQDLYFLKNARPLPTAPEPTKKTYSPTWSTNPLDAQQLKDIQDLKDAYPNLAKDDVFKKLFQKGFDKQQIIDLINKLKGAGATDDQIFAFLKAITTAEQDSPYYKNSPTPQTILNFVDMMGRAKNYPLSKFIQDFGSISHIPGSDRLLQYIMMQTGKKGQQDGYLYELKWIAEHKNDVARIEDVAEDANGANINRQAADVVMKGNPNAFVTGAIVDTKSIDWSDVAPDKASKNRPTQRTMPDTLRQLLNQIGRDKTLYPGYPIVYCYDSSKEPPPAIVVKTLMEKGVTVMSSPPDRIIAPPQQQNDPQRTKIQDLQNAVNGIDQIRQILNGGGSVPQLPGSSGGPQISPGQNPNDPPLQIQTN